MRRFFRVATQSPGHQKKLDKINEIFHYLEKRKEKQNHDLNCVRRSY